MERALAAAFAENLERRGEVGAAVAVWRAGEEVVSICGGVRSRERGAPEWSRSTLVPVWSATKGPAATTLLWALDEAGLDVDDPVRGVWPKLSVEVTFAQLLSHQAGLAALDAPVDATDYAAVVHALERQSPQWTPGGGHGYHPRTAGYLWDECVRRVTQGESLGAFWRRRIADPLEIDVWIGLPVSEHGRVATVHAGRPEPRPGEADFLAAWSDPSSLTRRAFASPRGLTAVAEMNAPEVWAAGYPAFGGLASADGLARFYSLLAAGVGGSAGPIPARVLRWIAPVRAEGFDLILRMPTTFTSGFQRDPIDPFGAKTRRHFGPSPRAFGHPGAGGCLGFADPDRGLGFSYVMNVVGPGVMPGPRAQALVEAVYAPDH